MKKRNVWNRILSVALSAALTVSMTAMPAKADTEATLPEPIAYFDFENDAVDGYFEGNGAVAKLVGNPTREETVNAGKITQTLKPTDGKYIQILDSRESDAYTGFGGRKAFTVTWWEKASSGNSTWTIWTQDKNGTGDATFDHFAVTTTATQDGVQIGTRGAGAILANNLSFGTWRHMAVVVTETGAQIYVNGQCVQDVTNQYSLSKLLGTNTSLYLGYSLAWGQAWARNINLDEFKIYGSALSAEQVTLDYEAEIAGEIAPDEAFIAGVTNSNFQLSSETVIVPYSTTVAEILSGVSTDPKDAVVEVYTDTAKNEKKSSKEMVEAGDVIAVSADDCLTREYEISVTGYSLPEPEVYLDFEDDDANEKGYYATSSGEYRAQSINDPRTENVVLKNKNSKAIKFVRDGSRSKYLKLVDAYGSNETTTVLNRKKSFTVTWWEKAMDTTTSWPFFALKNGTAASDRFYTGIISTQTTMKIQKENGTAYEASTSVNAGWRHVAAVFNKSGAKLYVNGALKGTLSENTSLNSILSDEPIVYIGYSSWQSGEGSNLYMDEFRLYTSALSAEQVSMDYNREINGTELDNPATIGAVDESVAILDTAASTLTMNYGVTAAQLKAAITTEPEGGTVKVYTDADKLTEVEDSVVVSYNNVIGISKEGYAETTYTVAYNVQKQVFSVFETEDTKSIVYTQDDLMALSINDNAGGDAKNSYIDDETGYEVIPMAGWTSKSWFYLPTINLINLSSVKMDSRITWYNSASAVIQLNMIDSSNTSTTVGSRTYWGTTSEYETNQYFNKATSDIDLSRIMSMEVMYTGNNNGALSGAGLRNVTCTYTKSDIEKALDDLIARAEAVPNPDAALNTALMNAKSCKLSYAADCTEALIRLAYDDMVMQDAYDTLLEVLPEEALEYETIEIVSWDDEQAGEFANGIVTVQYDTTVAMAKAAITLSADGTIDVYQSNADYLAGADPLRDDDLMVTNGLIVVKGSGHLTKKYPVVVRSAPALSAAIVAMPATIGYVSGNVLVLQASSRNLTIAELKKQLSCSPASAVITVLDENGNKKNDNQTIAETDMLTTEATGYLSDTYTLMFLTANAQLVSLDETVGVMIGQCLYLENGVTVNRLRKAITAEKGATFAIYQDAVLADDGTVTGTKVSGDDLVQKGYSVIVTKEGCNPSAYSVVDIEEIIIPSLYIAVTDTDSYATIITGGLLLENGTTVANLKSSIIVKASYYNKETKKTEITTVDGAAISVHEPGGLLLGAAREDKDLIVAGDVLLIEKEGYTSSQTTIVRVKDKASNTGSSGGGGGGFTAPVTGTVDITGGSSNSDAEENVPFSRVIKKSVKTNQWQIKVDDGYTLYYSLNGAEEKQYKKKLTLPVGTHIITAYAVDEAGKKSQTVEYTIVVKKPSAKVKSVTLNAGAKQTMKVKNSTTASKIVYKSLDKKVATVTKSGVVKAIRKGTTKIKATLKIGGKNVSVTMKVKVK